MLWLPPTTRRRFLSSSLAAGLGMAFSPGRQRIFGAEAATPNATSPKAKACILVWLNGGPSHIDTFDPKPGAKTNGPFAAIDTAVPGMRLCEHLPKLAQQAGRFALIRSMTSKEEDHDRAYRLLHTGAEPNDTVDMPSLGAVITHEQPSDGDLPAFVSIQGDSAGAGFLGLEYAPLIINDLDNPVVNIAVPEGIDEPRQLRRLRALESLNKGFAKRADSDLTADSERLTAKALRFQRSPSLKAFQIGEEPEGTLERYGAVGDTPLFGKSCIMARRLIEQGVRFVEVRLDGWDTHDNNFAQVGGLLGQLDPALAALIADLADRNLLDETLVACIGEFGRTPKINPQNGRDHWAHAFSALVAGGGIRGGQVIGATDAEGAEVSDRPVSVSDLFATLLTAKGLDPARQVTTPQGRPIKIADKGQVVQELFR